MKFRTLLALVLTAATLPYMTTAQAQQYFTGSGLPPGYSREHPPYSLSVAVSDSEGHNIFSGTMNCGGTESHCETGVKEIRSGTHMRLFGVATGWIERKSVLGINYWFPRVGSDIHGFGRWEFERGPVMVELPLQPQMGVRIALHDTSSGYHPDVENCSRSTSQMSMTPCRRAETAKRPMGYLTVQVIRIGN